ncbi:exported hypothetical protein [Candidatus Sulfopaludibacter sp. SbA4]|nr:exported hypothetical protein [Candidatus Sulfopaludibacter sp. SbA4]
MQILTCLCAFVLICSGCYGQASQAPATAEELQYFRFTLMNLASLDHSPDSVKTYEDSLVKQFGLNAQESATIHAAAQSLNALLKQLRQSAQATLKGKQSLSSGDLSSLSALSARREQLIATLSNQILNAVRPETAARLRVPGNVVASSVAKAQGK